MLLLQDICLETISSNLLQSFFIQACSNSGEPSQEKVAYPVWKIYITSVVILRAVHATQLYTQELTLTSPTSGGR
jgi:hypothetical protein